MMRSKIVIRNHDLLKEPIEHLIGRAAFAVPSLSSNTLLLDFRHLTSTLSHFIDFIPAFIKTFLFGAVIGFVGCYKGYHAGKGTASVGETSHSSVVQASLFIIIVELIAIQNTDMLI